MKATDRRMRSIFGVEEEGTEEKEGKRLTLWVVAPDAVLEDERVSRINLRNCVASIELNTSPVALFNANAEVRCDAEV